MPGIPACSHHPGRDAEHWCPECQAALCTDCAVETPARGGPVAQCKRCDAMLLPVDRSPLSAPPDDPGGFLARLPDFAMFPVQRDVLFVLLGLAVIVTPIRYALSYNMLARGNFLGWLLTDGLELSIYFHIVTSTAHGVRELDPPDFTAMWDDFAAPLIRYLGAVLPIALGVVWFALEVGSFGQGMALFDERSTAVLDYPGPTLAIAVGVLLWPLLTIIAAVSGSLAAVLNPALWLRTLRILGATYAVATAAFYAVLAVEVFVWLPVLSHVRDSFSIPIVTTVITATLGYLPMVLRARMLGGLLEPHFAHMINGR